MTLKDLLNEYLNGGRDAISVIRTLSGMFDPVNATDLLVLICAVTRIEQGDLDKDTFRKVFLGEKDDDLA